MDEWWVISSTFRRLSETNHISTNSLTILCYIAPIALNNKSIFISCITTPSATRGEYYATNSYIGSSIYWFNYVPVSTHAVHHLLMVFCDLIKSLTWGRLPSWLLHYTDHLLLVYILYPSVLTNMNMFICNSWYYLFYEYPDRSKPKLIYHIPQSIPYSTHDTVVYSH